MNRRAFLAAAASVTTGVAGCFGGTVPGGSGSDDAGLQLRSVDVAGSPGGQVGIRPPDRVVLLDFFATWCLPCKPEMANLRAVRERFSESAVFIVSITQETDEEAIREFWREYDGTWPVLIDADLEATKRYDVTGIPTILVLTPDGTTVMRHTGLAGESRLVQNVQEALRTAGLE